MTTATATPPAPASVGGTITIPTRCKPSKACSTDRTRPTLCHAALQRHDGSLWICATDNYIAVAVKVEGDADEGRVPIGALRLMERGLPAVQVSETAWKVQTNDGAVTFDCGDIRNFPDFKGLGVWDKPEGAGVEAIGIHPVLMARIGLALGARNGCRMQFVAPLRPIWVTPLSLGHDGVAIQMPIRLND